jgi:hypothetical protein
MLTYAVITGDKKCTLIANLQHCSSRAPSQRLKEELVGLKDIPE